MNHTLVTTPILGALYAGYRAVVFAAAVFGVTLLFAIGVLVFEPLGLVPSSSSATVGAGIWFCAWVIAIHVAGTQALRATA